MSAGRICSRVIATAAPTETVREAARRMAEYDVGTIVVLDAEHPDRAAGVVTDRDLAIRCVAEGVDPVTTPVAQLMSAPAHALDEDAPIEEATKTMAAAGTRRLVITDVKGRVVGILSLDDVLDVLVDQAGAIGHLLEKQRPHVAA